ncbi:50S ribosomal protein L3 [Candidatus Woesearchaeota archaeon]|nr:50S ribosomal protein L3 [Candidatus Woesearchaeota archaeon]
MGKAGAPRSGSMQFWPRKRANKSYARVRSFPEGQGILAFAGYKMGMARMQGMSHVGKKPEPLTLPVTILECPPMRIHSVRGYNRGTHGLFVSKEVIIPSKDKYLGRKVNAKPGKTSALDTFSSFFQIRVLLMTQPGKTGIGQKKPQIFEVSVGGKNAEEQLATVKELLDKDIKASELFKEGELVDIHAITTGRGYQGPVKRFGIGLKSHKSEKGVRRPGSLGGWSGQQHFMYRNANAGQTGYHQRVQYNNQILKITDNPDEIQVKGGFIHYGTARKGNEFVVITGSVPGPKKRLITIVKSIRGKKRKLPEMEIIHLDSAQGK